MKHPSLTPTSWFTSEYQHQNFKRLVWAPITLYRPQTKTRGSYLIGLHFDLQRGWFDEALRAPKREKPGIFWGPLGSSREGPCTVRLGSVAARRYTPRYSQWSYFLRAGGTVLMVLEAG